MTAGYVILFFVVVFLCLYRFPIPASIYTIDFKNVIKMKIETKSVVNIYLGKKYFLTESF